MSERWAGLAQDRNKGPTAGESPAHQSQPLWRLAFPGFPALGRNGKALGSVMQHCGSPAQDHLLWWLLDPRLGKVYLRGFWEDQLPWRFWLLLKILGFVDDTPGDWHFSEDKYCFLIRHFQSGIAILCWSQLLVLCSRRGRKSWHWVCRLAVLQSSY